MYAICIPPTFPKAQYRRSRSLVFPAKVPNVVLTLPVVSLESVSTGGLPKIFGHSLKDQHSNRRSHLPGYGAWEIHPVMALQIVQ